MRKWEVILARALRATRIPTQHDAVREAPGQEVSVCGRYTLRTAGGRVAHAVGLPSGLDLRPRYNIAPAQDVPAVRSPGGGGRELAMLRWGLVPSWARDSRIGSRLINARAETVLERPAYRRAFRFRRCLMLADGFFEWQRVGRSRLPFYARMRDDRPFVFAGLWETRQEKDGSATETCALITTEPNELLRRVHDRMPVILGPDQQEHWLDPAAPAASLAGILRPYPADEMRLYQVSRWVNDPRNDDPRCVEPIPANDA